MTILVGFFLFIFLIQAIVFGNLSRLFMALLGAELPDSSEKGLPSNPESLTAYGYGVLVASLITVPLAIWVYRAVIVRWCEGRHDGVPELALTPAAKRWIGWGALIAGAVVMVVVLAVMVGGGVAARANAHLLSGLAYAVGISLFAGVVEELFARGVLFRISEQHTGSLMALIVTAFVFGLQHADNPSATPLSVVAIALEGGIMLASVYMLARTLWAVFAVHFVWNFGQSVLGLPVSGNETIGAVSLQLSGPQRLTGGAFGIEVSWLAIGLWTLVTIALLVAVARRGQWVTWQQARGRVAAGQGNVPVE